MGTFYLFIVMFNVMERPQNKLDQVQEGLKAMLQNIYSKALTLKTPSTHAKHLTENVIRSAILQVFIRWKSLCQAIPHVNYYCRNDKLLELECILNHLSIDFKQNIDFTVLCKLI